MPFLQTANILCGFTVPLSLQNGKRFSFFLLISFSMLAFLKENIPLPDSNLNSRICLFGIDSKQSSQLYGPPLSRTGNVLHAFYLQSFCVLSFYTKTFRFTFTPAICQDCTDPRIQHGFLLSKDKVLSLLATSLLNRNPYGFPINGSPVF